jgi:hypothetical protein
MPARTHRERALRYPDTNHHTKPAKPKTRRSPTMLTYRARRSLARPYRGSPTHSAAVLSRQPHHQQTANTCHKHHTPQIATGGLPWPPLLYISIICCVGVWFCGHCEWLTPCTWEVGGGLTTVCGFGFVSCWEIYAHVCISGSDGG